jgi:diadenosine tetraphosphate (Ap4A) HIT family hydrolase
MQVAAPVRGYVCLVSKIHAVELHDLAEETALAFIHDARRVSKSLSYVTGAVKINYEIHGNSIPHLHMHFFPRYRGDQFEGGPINPKQTVQPVYSAGEFDQIRHDFIEALLPGILYAERSKSLGTDNAHGDSHSEMGSGARLPGAWPTSRY